MDAGLLGPLIPITAIIAVAAVMIARLRATRAGPPSVEVTARLDALERSLQDVQQELAETQERLDFAERLLSQAREDRRLGGWQVPWRVSARSGCAAFLTIPDVVGTCHT